MFDTADLKLCPGVGRFTSEKGKMKCRSAHCNGIAAPDNLKNLLENLWPHDASIVQHEHADRDKILHRSGEIDFARRR